MLAALRTIPRALMRIRRHRVRRIVSTGAGLAVPFFVVGRALGIECHYVESAARVATPRLTGCSVSRLPGVRLYTQYRTAARHACLRALDLMWWHLRDVTPLPPSQVVATRPRGADGPALTPALVAE